MNTEEVKAKIQALKVENEREFVKAVEDIVTANLPKYDHAAGNSAEACGIDQNSLEAIIESLPDSSGFVSKGVELMENTFTKRELAFLLIQQM